MSFTFDLESDDNNTVTISQLRLAIGDTEEDDGLLPGGQNISDEILIGLYEAEGNHEKRALAGIYEHLSSRWAARARRNRLGPNTEWFDAAQEYKRTAERYRKRYGYAEDAPRPAGGSAYTSASVL